jgi:hypothetical protein
MIFYEMDFTKSCYIFGMIFTIGTIKIIIKIFDIMIFYNMSTKTLHSMTNLNTYRTTK